MHLQLRSRNVLQPTWGCTALSLYPPMYRNQPGTVLHACQCLALRPEAGCPVLQGAGRQCCCQHAPLCVHFGSLFCLDIGNGCVAVSFYWHRACLHMQRAHQTITAVCFDYVVCAIAASVSGQSVYYDGNAMHICALLACIWCLQARCLASANAGLGMLFVFGTAVLLLCVRAATTAVGVTFWTCSLWTILSCWVAFWNVHILCAE